MLNQKIESTVSHDEPLWYKQFWPWFLIILPGIVVVASITTVIIAFRGADTLVADNYYKEGLAINKTVADLNTAKTLNIKGLASITGESLNLTITSNTPITDDELLLSFSHPLDNMQDIVIHLKHTGNGIYQANIPELAHSKWYITLQSLNEAMPWRIIQTAYLPNTRIEFSAQ